MLDPETSHHMRHALEAGPRVGKATELPCRLLGVARVLLLMEVRHRLGRVRQPAVADDADPQADRVHHLAVPFADLAIEGPADLVRPGRPAVRAVPDGDADVLLAADHDPFRIQRGSVERALVRGALDGGQVFDVRALDRRVVHSSAVSAQQGRLALDEPDQLLDRYRELLELCGDLQNDVGGCRCCGCAPLSMGDDHPPSDREERLLVQVTYLQYLESIILACTNFLREPRAHAQGEIHTRNSPPGRWSSRLALGRHRGRRR
jgi:hypothetical protein